MTTETLRVRAAEAAPVTGSALSEIGWVAYRSLLRVSRTPIVLFFSLMMPLMWLLLFSQTFGSVVGRGMALPGAAPLPYDFVAILLPGIATMTAIQSASQSGFGMVADIESGYMDKFFVSPMRRSSVLLGKLLADGLRIAVQSMLVLAIAWVMTLLVGWRIPFATGFFGALLLSVLVALFGVAFSGLSNTVALRTRSTEATMTASFALTFPLLFMSTAMLPAQALPGWVQSIAVVNPVSYLADASRALILTGYDWAAIGKALVAIAIVGALLNGWRSKRSARRAAKVTRRSPRPPARSGAVVAASILSPEDL